MTKIAHFLAVLIYAKEDLCIKPKKTTTQTKNNSNLSSIYGKKKFYKNMRITTTQEQTFAGSFISISNTQLYHL
jgi:hypothetical protein